MLKIGNHKIGKNEPVFIMAELGINHLGNIRLAKKLISAAAKCGANAIKFQTIFPEEVYSKKIEPEIFHLLKKSQLTKKQWIELKNYAKRMKIEFFSTPAGEKSLKLLKEIGVPCIKIGSGELNKLSLIKNTAKLGKPMIISTGMSTLPEISSIVKIVKKENCPFILLHCNSCYPSPIHDTNLSTINFLEKKFKVNVGYSDHTVGISACLAAVALGACVIEKHFILNKSAWKKESKLSSNPREFTTMVHHIRTIEKALGSPRSGITNSEKNSRKSMRYSVATILDIKSGTKINRSMLTILRPGTGISPSEINNLIGLKINKNVKEGNLLRWNMFDR